MAYTFSSLTAHFLKSVSFESGSVASSVSLLTPPGAINENAFASACVRCGQCVQACPYDTLKLATLASGLSAGTPYFVARDIPCEMCEDIPCAKVCPSGALDREIE